MTSKLAGPKDFWIGLMYIGFGSLGLYLGWNYKFGTAGRMGPGYFPLVLAWILVGLGFISLVRSFFVKGSAIGKIAWLQLALIVTAVVCFAFLLPRIGAFFSLSVLAIISAMASNEFGFEDKAALGLIGIILACVVVFVIGLGVPMPLLGSWLEPTLGPVLYPITSIITKATLFGRPIGVPLSLMLIGGLTALFVLLKRKA